MATKPTTLTFLGAAGTVTGSKYLLTIGSRRVLVDSGMFQGEKKWRLMNWEEFPVDPASISDLVLTHAHMDHVGYLPALTRAAVRSGLVWKMTASSPSAAVPTANDTKAALIGDPTAVISLAFVGACKAVAPPARMMAMKAKMFGFIIRSPESQATLP